MDSGELTSSGVAVNQESALKLTAVYACVRLIAWTIASLPIKVFDEVGNGKVSDKTSPVYKLLHDKPNDDQTPFEFKSLLSVHQLLWGAGFAEIKFDPTGQPVSLTVIHPATVEIKRTESDVRFYRVRTASGGYRNIQKENMLHFPALLTDRDSIKSPIMVHAETIGFAQAVRKFGAKTFGSGTNPAGMLTFPDGVNLSKTSEDSLKESLKQYAGLGGAHKVMWIPGGGTFQRIGLPPEDAQYLETQKFTTSDIARIYSVPLFLLQDIEKSTSWGTGLEEMGNAYVKFTLLPYFVQWEQEIKLKLIYEPNKYCKFNADALMRGKLLERYQAYNIGRNGGWLSADDIRAKEDDNPLPDGLGETYLIPSNMMIAGEDKSEEDDDGIQDDTE
jgi:HK97 family phage portal protein